MGSALLSIVGISVLLWFWNDNLRAREQVLAACALACKRVDVQLLDQTVVLSSLRIARTTVGGFCLARNYSFEFSTDGAKRYKGRAVLSGWTVGYVFLDHPDGGTVIDPSKKEHETRH